MNANSARRRGKYDRLISTAEVTLSDDGGVPNVALSLRGFTLLELLVVITTIAVIASLLLPALSRARGSAQGAICAGNMRQLAQGWLMYSDDNGDQLTSNSDGQDGNGVFTNWVAGTMSSKKDRTNSVLLVSSQLSALARYISVPGLYKCPGDNGLFVRSVSMNGRLNPTRTGGTPAFTRGGGNDRYATFRRANDIRTPDAIFVVLDERSDSINDGYFGVDMSNTGTLNGSGPSNPYWIIDYPASYHAGSGRVSFADGHVETHQWLEPNTLASLGRARPGSRSSSTDRDIKWIQDHCTFPN